MKSSSVLSSFIRSLAAVFVAFVAGLGLSLLISDSPPLEVVGVYLNRWPYFGIALAAIFIALLSGQFIERRGNNDH